MKGERFLPAPSCFGVQMGYAETSGRWEGQTTPTSYKNPCLTLPSPPSQEPICGNPVFPTESPPHAISTLPPRGIGVFGFPLPVSSFPTFRVHHERFLFTVSVLSPLRTPPLLVFTSLGGPPALCSWRVNKINDFLGMGKRITETPGFFVFLLTLRKMGCCLRPLYGRYVPDSIGQMIMFAPLNAGRGVFRGYDVTSLFLNLVRNPYYTLVFCKTLSHGVCLLFPRPCFFVLDCWPPQADLGSFFPPSCPPPSFPLALSPLFPVPPSVKVTPTFLLWPWAHKYQRCAAPDLTPPSPPPLPPPSPPPPPPSAPWDLNFAGQQPFSERLYSHFYYLVWPMRLGVGVVVPFSVAARLYYQAYDFLRGVPIDLFPPRLVDRPPCGPAFDSE